MVMNPAKLRAYGLTTVIIMALMLIATTAQAYDCTDQGQPGWYNGTTADDAGCITQAEYELMFSVDSLEDAGVLVSPVDNGNGTTTGSVSLTGVEVTIVSKALDRPVAANPTASSPTVREILFPATAARLSALIG